MNARVPVAILWNEGNGASSQLETGFTRVVNTYGCLLVSPKEISMRQRLRLANLATRAEAGGVVVWKGSRRPDGWDLGVELVDADLNFWGVEL